RSIRERPAVAEEDRAAHRLRLRTELHRLREVRRAVPVRGTRDGPGERPVELPRHRLGDREELHRLPRMREGLPVRRDLHLSEGPGPRLAEELARRTRSLNSSPLSAILRAVHYTAHR